MNEKLKENINIYTSGRLNKIFRKQLTCKIKSKICARWNMLKLNRQWIPYDNRLMNVAIFTQRCTRVGYEYIYTWAASRLSRRRPPNSPNFFVAPKRRRKKLRLAEPPPHLLRRNAAEKCSAAEIFTLGFTEYLFSNLILFLPSRLYHRLESRLWVCDPGFADLGLPEIIIVLLVLNKLSFFLS